MASVALQPSFHRLVPLQLLIEQKIVLNYTLVSLSTRLQRLLRQTDPSLQSFRSFAALPQPHPDAGDEETSNYRLSEEAKKLRFTRWKETLPSIAETAVTLKRRGNHPGDGRFTDRKPPTTAANEPPLSWRDVVQRAKPGLVHSAEHALTDSFGRRHTYLRISLTERCNLRCLYCMPEQGVDLTPRPDLLTTEELVRLARLFATAGVTKVRLTGGEPTLRRDLPEIVHQLASIPNINDVGLTSNGLTLARTLPELQAAGLSLLNISLDTLRSDRFVQMTRRRGLDRVLETINTAANLGFDPVKVNVVVMNGVNDDEISDFVNLTRAAPINVRFIEYMPFDGNVWSSDKLLPWRHMARAVAEASGVEDERALVRRDDPAGEVAKNFVLPGHRGSVSFVTSMTSAFCGDCNRLRLMADGNLKVCLFGANEVSLRDALREGATDDDLLAVVSAAVDRKKAAHAGMFEIARTKNRAMVKIGG